MKTAVVILNWNGADFLKQFLPTLIKFTQNTDTEIIVADNGSTDNSLLVLAENFSEIKTVVLDKNYGYARGYNLALQQIDAEYFVLLNSDIEVTENWLNPLIDYLDSNPDTAACQPKIRSFVNRDKFEHAGAAGGFIDILGYPFCRGRVLGVTETDNGQYDNVCEVFWATGACLVIRSEVFKKTGGFDADFFAHMEEIDLCWRLKCRGYKIVCIPESLIFHVGGGTLKMESPYKTYLNFRNNNLMLYKNLSQKDFKKVIAIRRLLDYLAAVQFFITGHAKNARSVVKARKDFKKMLPQFTEKRNENLLYATTVPADSTVLNKSVIWNYYFRKKQTYSELMK
jgi:Predicted glycosyltransferases